MTKLSLFINVSVIYFKLKMFIKPAYDVNEYFADCNTFDRHESKLKRTDIKKAHFINELSALRNMNSELVEAAGVKEIIQPFGRSGFDI